MWVIAVTFIALLALTCWPRIKRQATIKKWYKTYSLDKHHAVFQTLFSGVDGFDLSQQSRMKSDAIDYTYGEIDYIPFIALLCMANPNQNTVFYDLGSGTGKAVLACAMTFKVQKSCGIELFHLLHEKALNLQTNLKELPQYRGKAETIHFIHGNFLERDLSDATLVFINATAFFGDAWLDINQHLTQLNRGTTVITTSKKLSSDAFNLCKTTTVNMSWGPVRAYIHHRA